MMSLISYQFPMFYRFPIFHCFPIQTAIWNAKCPPSKQMPLRLFRSCSTPLMTVPIIGKELGTQRFGCGIEVCIAIQRLEVSQGAFGVPIFPIYSSFNGEPRSYFEFPNHLLETLIHRGAATFWEPWRIV